MIEVYLRMSDQLIGGLLGSFSVDDLDTLLQSVKNHQTAESLGEIVIDDMEWNVTSQYVIHQGNRKTWFEIIVEYVRQSGE